MSLSRKPEDYTDDYIIGMLAARQQIDEDLYIRAFLEMAMTVAMERLGVSDTGFDFTVQEYRELTVKLQAQEKFGFAYGAGVDGQVGLMRIINETRDGRMSQMYEALVAAADMEDHA